MEKRRWTAVPLAESKVLVTVRPAARHIRAALVLGLSVLLRKMGRSSVPAGKEAPALK
jgi:hypothetical protein